METDEQFVARMMGRKLSDASPEIQASCKRIAARPHKTLTPEEIEAWAQRLVADVAHLRD